MRPSLVSVPASRGCARQHQAAHPGVVPWCCPGCIWMLLIFTSLSLFYLRVPQETPCGHGHHVSKGARDPSGRMAGRRTRQGQCRVPPAQARLVSLVMIALR